jgi:enediyne biosynthesis protein E3
MSQTSIPKKIELVFTTFHEAQSIAENASFEELFEKLHSYEPEFRSVAFEAASMSILSSDLKKNGNSPSDQWNNFFAAHKSLHKSQLLTGFGWALALHEKNPSDFLDQFDPLISMRILDGYGYYHGLLRSRRSVQNIQIPNYITEDLLFAFDQGLGRALWYLSKGDLEKLMTMLEKFPAQRKENLWRGIGTASAYVGGIDSGIYQELNLLAANYSKQFVVGIIFAIRTRMQSNSVTEYIQEACRTLTDFNIDTAYKFTEETKKKAGNYEEWLSIMTAAI